MQKAISFSHKDTSRLQLDALKKHGELLRSVYPRVRDALKSTYDSPYAAVFAPADAQAQQSIWQLVEQVRTLQPALVVVIGVGGSLLGARAVDQAVRSTCCAKKIQLLPVLYVDNIDSDALASAVQTVEQVLQAGKNIILNVVTKSGTTLETIVNYAIFTDVLKKYHPTDLSRYVVVTTDEGSPLADYAREQNIHCLLVPKLVGGRYSIFTAVGLFPLGLMGVDVQALCAGAASMTEACLAPAFEENVAAQSATLLYAWYLQKMYVHNLFLFDSDLFALGMWYRQLLAESIGKQHDLQGRAVHVGITPLISIGTADLHSMVELHLSGQQNVATTFVFVQESACAMRVPRAQVCQKLMPYVQGLSVADIMRAVEGGVQHAYAHKEHPFSVVTLPEKSAWHLGQFMQWKMFEVMYLGALLGIDPFVQPQVELYKRETRNILSHG